MTVHVTIAGQDFNATTAHTDPVRWSLDIDAGWDSPDLDMELLPTIGEGSAAGRIMVRHRTIVCKGFVEARDVTRAFELLEQHGGRLRGRARGSSVVPAWTRVHGPVESTLTGAQRPAGRLVVRFGETRSFEILPDDVPGVIDHRLRIREPRRLEVEGVHPAGVGTIDPHAAGGEIELADGDALELPAVRFGDGADFVRADGGRPPERFRRGRDAEVIAVGEPVDRRRRAVRGS